MRAVCTGAAASYDPTPMSAPAAPSVSPKSPPVAGDAARTASLMALAELFGPGDRLGGHIVDLLIEERARRLVGRPRLWSLAKRVLYPMLRYRGAVALADRIRDLDGAAIFDHVDELLGIDLVLDGVEHIPASGKVLVVANHPTGLADGIAVWRALRSRRADVCFFANSDALRVAPGFIDVMIPVEWVVEKRTMAKTRVMMARAGEAFAAGGAVVMFPSGRLAHWTMRGLRDKPWFATVLTFARKYRTPILPLNIRARNSLVYYLFHALNAELRDITLFNETLNKAGHRFRLTFGPLIGPEALAGDETAALGRLKAYIEEDLVKGRAFGD